MQNVLCFAGFQPPVFVQVALSPPLGCVLALAGLCQQVPYILLWWPGEKRGTLCQEHLSPSFPLWAWLLGMLREYLAVGAWLGLGWQRDAWARICQGVFRLFPAFLQNVR